MSDIAGRAWAKERKAHPRAAYVAGYDRGLSDAAGVIAAQIDDNLDLLRTFAPNKTPELIAHLIRTCGRTRAGLGTSE